MRVQRYHITKTDRAEARELANACGLQLTIAQLLLQRGISDADCATHFLQARLAHLNSPAEMADRHCAAQRMAEAIRRREHIAVFGDYDVDGTTSAVIIAEALECMGADRVSTLIAERFQGYGLSEHAAQRVLDTGASLLITCDCGSSDHERIAFLNTKGVQTVVVDHHLVPKEPLPAVAFLNPHRPECGYPYKGLASAGLAFMLAAALRDALQLQQVDVRPWLDLVALGTIADVAPLTHDNRCLVRAGLRRIGQAQVRPGVQALLNAVRIQRGHMVGASDVAFRLAPRLNAPGRLGHADITRQLLQARHKSDARAMMQLVEGYNRERKALEQRISAEAREQLLEVYGPAPKGGVVLAGHDWHRGVVGITAARIAEEFRVPAVVVAWYDDIGHGSGRTPAGIPLYDALAQSRSLLRSFGGHQAAIGLSLHKDRLDALRSDFASATTAAVASLPCPDPCVDIELDRQHFPTPQARDLWHLEPLGAANPAPTFALPQARIQRKSIIAKQHLKLKLNFEGQMINAFVANQAALADTLPDRFTAIGTLGPDNWQRGNAVELMMRHFQP